MAALGDVFNRALKTKRGSAYLFVNRSDSDAVSSSDPDCHIIELRENDELERTNHARPRPLVRSSTQLTLDNLQFTSKFTKKEVSQLYREFKFECPAGHVTKEQFRSLYQKCYPLGGSAHYAGYLFDTLDQDNHGNVTFTAFLFEMSVLSRGTTEEKLKWIFTLYDIDKNRYITKVYLRSLSH